jgi:hypothetical protein
MLFYCPIGETNGRQSSVGAICERVAEVQALLDDHIADGRHSAAGVIAKAQAVLSVVLLPAMFDVGYFPLNMPLVE